ncbi:hypothetical protein GCM10009627_06000 [Curtobacterium herbarum]|uniref:Uncharacterized protein n=1 Tax=Curtobacterium herbarum TaxID=150122 RepID=A0ABP4K3U3_9MICO
MIDPLTFPSPPVLAVPPLEQPVRTRAVAAAPARIAATRPDVVRWVLLIVADSFVELLNRFSLLGRTPA